MTVRKLVLCLGVVLSCVVSAGCGGDKDKPVKSPSSEVTEDALALLPGNAIAVGTVDARAFFGSPSFGSELAKVVEKYMPVGQEAGFSASRDVDRVTFASYSYQGIDVAAVIVGRFDEAKIKQTAMAHAGQGSGGAAGTPAAGAPATTPRPAAGQSMVVASQYAGRDVYTVNNVGFTLLSSTRAIAGTESGIRRVLDRIRDKRTHRDIAAWMIGTLETPGAALAIAGDFATNPLPAEATRQIPIPFLQGMKALRVVGTFKEPGVQLATSLTYNDAQAAQTASAGVKQLLGMSSALALVGVKLQSSDVVVEQSDVQVKLTVDDQSLRQLVTSAPQWLGR